MPTRLLRPACTPAWNRLTAPRSLSRLAMCRRQRQAELAGDHLVGETLGHQRDHRAAQVVRDIGVAGLASLERRARLPRLIEQVEKKGDDLTAADAGRVRFSGRRRAEQNRVRAVEHDRGSRHVAQRANRSTGGNRLDELGASGQLGAAAVLADDPGTHTALGEPVGQAEQLVEFDRRLGTGDEHQRLVPALVAGKAEVALHLERAGDVLDRRVGGGGSGAVEVGPEPIAAFLDPRDLRLAMRDVALHRRGQQRGGDPGVDGKVPVAVRTGRAQQPLAGELVDRARQGVDVEIQLRRDRVVDVDVAV
jgi:hypothetical protein